MPDVSLVMAINLIILRENLVRIFKYLGSLLIKCLQSKEHSSAIQGNQLTLHSL